ncbi:MAG: inverse autotransporter beta domain-containing protein, partial [Gammaproteobacteria bacterium]
MKLPESARKNTPAKLAIISLAACLASVSNAYADAYYGRIDVAGYGQSQQNAQSADVLIDAFIPILQMPSTLWYTNFRGFSRSKSGFEGNLGTGIRWISADNSTLAGAYGFFDRRRTETGNYFNQGVVGGELWYNNLFIGGNVYVPMGQTEKQTDLYNFVDLIPLEDDVRSDIYNLMAAPGFEKSMGGFDIEVGYEILPGFTAFAGGYVFTASEIDSVVGPRVRATYDWTNVEKGQKILGIFDKISFETEARNDQLRGTSWYGGIRFSVGLGKLPKLQGAARHMLDPVRRDIDLVTTGYHLDPELIRSLTIAEVRNWDELTDANRNEKINAILVKEDIAFNRELPLSDGKTLTGDRLEVTTNSGGITFDVSLKAQSELPTLSSVGHNLIKINSNAMIYDLNLSVSNPTQYAVISNINPNQSIEKLQIDNVYANGPLSITLNNDNKGYLWVNRSTFNDGN